MNEGDYKKFMTDISKEHNSRGELSYNNGLTSRSLYYKVDNTGKLTVYDTQANKKLSDSQVHDTIYNSDPGAISYTRLDNSTPNIQYLKDNNYIC